MGKIVKIGSWDNAGMPTGWHIDLTGTLLSGYVMKIEEDGRVFIGDIEIVEWSELRKQAIQKGKP